MADQSEFMTILPSSRASPKWVPGGHTLDKQIGRQPATPAQLPAARCRATSLVARWQADRFLGRAPGQKVKIYSFDRWRNAARNDTRRPPAPFGP
jgi:hypothetical protein